MANPAIEIIRDPSVAAPPSAREGPDGVSGQVSYLVHTEKVFNALAMTPARGAPWPLNDDVLLARRLRLVGKSGRYRARRDANGPLPTSGGQCIVTCDFAMPGGGRLSLEPVAGAKWTELAYGSESVTVYHSIDPASWEQDFVINNGDGVARKVGTLQARVYALKTASAPLPLARLTALTRAKNLNDGNLSLPPLDGVGGPLNFAAEQVQFEGWSSRMVVGKNGEPLRELAFDLSLSDNFYTYWNIENEKGQAIAVAFAPIYENADLSGLW